MHIIAFLKDFFPARETVPAKLVTTAYTYEVDQSSFQIVKQGLSKLLTPHMMTAVTLLNPPIAVFARTGFCGPQDRRSRRHVLGIRISSFCLVLLAGEVFMPFGVARHASYVFAVWTLDARLFGPADVKGA